MGYYDLDSRTQLLLRALAANGIKMVVNDQQDHKVMQQMVKEGLFTYSDTMFSEGYWWTPAGERAAKELWQRLPVQRVIQTRYRNHPRVRISLNGNKEELCHVVGPWRSGLYVREIVRGRWLIDHPNGDRNVSFGSADEAIEWALRQGKAR